ncbi:MAG: SpvB/TcaC N-terminal domain-containing protein [Gammaproteobacteria bacterium]
MTGQAKLALPAPHRRPVRPNREHWTNVVDPKDTLWRSISKDDITTWYGKTSESRIADPADATRIFSWLICQSYDDKGNAIVYRYEEENSDGMNLSQAHEKNRTPASRSANRYIKHIYYGDREPNRDGNWNATDQSRATHRGRAHLRVRRVTLVSPQSPA